MDFTRTVMITVTQNCNLHCTYCYEHFKSPRTISFETAKKIIDVELMHRTKYDSFEFDLFGGEPFLEFDLVKKITEYICENSAGVQTVVFATTNGTMIHGEIQEWLKDHSCCFVCGLSLDGTREMHNRNRSNSYDSIDWRFFKENYPQQEVKMTISKETLPLLSSGVIDLHQKGFEVACNLAYGIDWSKIDNKAILQRELEVLIAYYLEHPEIKPCSMLGMGIENAAYDSTLRRYCGAGKEMISYDIDGKSYPCQFFMPLSVGNEKAKKSCSIVFPEDEIPLECLDEKCKSCVIRSICPNCFGSNYASTGNIYQRDDNLCILTKIIMKARSYFRAKQWEGGQLSNTPPEELEAMSRAIIRIQEELII